MRPKASFTSYVAANAVVLVAVSSLLLGCASSGDSTTTPPSSTGPARTLDELPAGNAPSVPYLHDGALYLGDTRITTSANQLLAAGDTVLVGRSAQQRARWWRLNDATLVPVPVLDDVFTPALSPSGDLLAWTAYPDERTTRVIAWDARTGTEQAHVDLDAPYAECCGGGQEIEIHGIDVDDVVYWNDRSGNLSWEPGHQPRRLDRGNDPIGPSALDVTMSRSAPLDVPAEARANPLVLEDEHHVLVDAFTDPRRHYVLRCDVTDGSCERALPPGLAESWVFPER